VNEYVRLVWRSNLVAEEADGFFTVDVLPPNNFFGMEKNFVIPRREVI
jgi:hypothetical protein